MFIAPTFVGMPAYALMLNMLTNGTSVKNIFSTFLSSIAMTMVVVILIVVFAILLISYMDI
jgi:CBS domain containing-hemolysin-like protein